MLQYKLFIQWNVDPRIIQTGSFALRYYSLLFMLGFILSYLLLKYTIKIPVKLLDSLTVYLFTGVIAGARMGHCLFYEPGYYLSHPLEIILPFSNGVFTGYQGLASHGAAIGILIALLLYNHKYKLGMLWLLDRLGIVVALCGACIRIGNFFNSEIIGTPSSLPWAVVFLRVDEQPRHPAQLYEAACYLLLFFLLLYLFRRFKLKPGQLFGYFLVSLFSVRFILEYLKENQEAFESALPVNMGQLLSIPFIIWGLYLVYRKGNQKLN